jgi:predicted nucleic acid-binding protein
MPWEGYGSGFAPNFNFCMIKIYLDTSVYNRLFDDQSQPKIFLETQAVVLLFQMIEIKIVDLVTSTVLEYENSKNPFPVKQQSMARYLKMAVIRKSVDDAIKERAIQLERDGLKAIDALHVACAEATQAKYFITCDKRLINRYQANLTSVLNPISFIMEMENAY